MYKIELMPAMLSPGFAQYGALPEHIVQSQTSLASGCAAGVPPRWQADPDKVQLVVWVQLEMTFDFTPELRISYDPHLVAEREVPGKLPGEP